jgi:hypothetical protein
MYDVGGTRSSVRTAYTRGCPGPLTNPSPRLHTAGGMVPLLRRRERDHLPRADLVLRREARGGPAGEPARGQLPAVAGGVRAQVAPAHADDPLPQQVRHP